MSALVAGPLPKNARQFDWIQTKQHPLLDWSDSIWTGLSVSGCATHLAVVPEAPVCKQRLTRPRLPWPINYPLQCDAVITRSISLTNIHKWHPIAHTGARGTGWAIVDRASEWHSASALVIIHEISYNIGPHYNGTQQYLRTGYTCKCSLLPGLT